MLGSAGLDDGEWPKSLCHAWTPLVALQPWTCFGFADPSGWTCPQCRQSRKPTRGSSSPANLVGLPLADLRPKLISRNLVRLAYSYPNVAASGLTAERGTLGCRVQHRHQMPDERVGFALVPVVHDLRAPGPRCRLHGAKIRHSADLSGVRPHGVAT